MFVIILNCITLGMYQPCSDKECDTMRCRILEGFDHFIFGFFALEMIIKMIAMGVIGKSTYLADSWNRLDCFIVVAGTVEYAVDTENLSLSAIRTIRVLRPLRAINRIPSMRILVMLLLDTLPMLGNVLLLCFFVFFIFGIIGVQLWSGVLRHRCFLELNESVGIPNYVDKYYIPKGKKTAYICSSENESGISKCENLPHYEYEGISCNATAKMYSNNTPTNESCVNWNQYYTNCSPHAKNPFDGAVSFDNIGLAWVAIFQVISLESWVNIMYFVQDAHSFWDWIYFVALIVIGSFFMINLCLVVIATQFSETKKRETERMMQERKRFQSCSTLASNSEPGGCYTELLKLVAQVYRRVKRKLLKAYYKTRGLQKINPEKSISLRRKKAKKKGTNTLKQHHPSSILRQHSLSHVPHVHHHQHQHLLPTPSPQPQQQQQQQQLHLQNTNLSTTERRYQSPPRPSSTPQAPRASPEQSDIDSMSSPRQPNYLVLPNSNYSLNPSSESLAMSHLSVDPFAPALLKSQQNSPNHLTANFGFNLPLSISRASSINSGASGPGRIFPTLPEVLAAQGAKNAVLAASNMLLSVDYEPNKTQTLADKGLFADNLLMDMVGDKQLSTQLSMQSEADGHQQDQDTGSCGGSGGIGAGDKELAGEHGTSNSTCNPSAVIIAGGDIVDSDLETSKEESGGSTRSRFLNFMQKKLKTFVESNVFQRSILLAILLNTLSMGVEYHNQPDLLTKILEYSNVVFCVLFGAEMAFKICAYGVFGYISNGFNVFDGFIVILSIVELAQGGASGLSVLRTFRLLRILKLVRFMPALRRQLVVMLRTMDNVATFFALLVLFMFIFSILGMNLFGGTFCEGEDGTPCSCQDRRNASIVCNCDRANFDNLIWSLVTVFQVLTQEDWNTVLYNGMSNTSNWASLYFVALMTFGNYVLFNLLVAILVEGFSTEDEEKKKEKMKELEDMDKDEDDEEEEEKEKQRLAENNNIDDIQSTKSRINSVDLDVKNNQEKEKKMLALPAQSGNPLKNDSPPQMQALPSTEGPLNPPIITHTAATPMATPQGSPNESAIKDNNQRLSVSVKRSALKSTLSVDSDKSTSHSFRGGSPRPSPCLRRTNSRGSHHQRSASWRARHRRFRGDKTNLVVDSLSDSADDVDDDVFSSTHSQSPTYSAGTPRTPSVNTHGDCNGHPPLNNQRTLSPQNSLKGRALTPRNSFKSHHSWSRNNSVGSGRSICNSFELSRQNSFTSHRTLNSLGSGNSKDDNKSNKNFVDLPDVKIALDKEEGREEEDDEEVDPDAIDETDWNCSWCPEPKGCFLTRHEYAFYLLSNDNKVRKFCQHLIAKKWFDNAVLFFIALNCITLAMERPDIPPKSVERKFLTYSNYLFTFVFFLEMVIKVIAKGFFIGKHAYMKSGWNVMDGFLVIISLIDIFISLSAASSPRIFGILRVFRLLRTLRPLRVISRAPGLKLVVQTLLSSLRPIGNIVLICCTFFIIFGILGVQLFKGTFYYCKGPDVEDVVNKTQCLSDRRNLWVNQKYNFDNLGMALMALFVLASKDGWVQIMYTGLDAVGVDQQPIENYNEWRLIYFISFLLLVAFFVLNMFVGVVVENFHKCRESQEIEERAKRAAKRQEKLDKKRKSEAPNALSELREPPYWAHYSHSRVLIHTVINSKYFDLAIAAVIGLNVITMAMEYHMMPEELKFALKIFNFFFTSVFILEAVMKIVALGFYRYIKDRWNQLDIMIVILSIIGIVLEEMESNVIPINPTIIRVMRVLRIARVLKLLKMAKGIRALLDTVIQALPQVGNLGLLFFLLFFIFAALGVELFGRLECSVKHPCEGLGVHAHFHNFGMAFLTLFRVATGDNWNGIMKDTLREDCDRSDNCLRNCCVSPLIAPVYFVVFVLMAQFVLVNVVVAVLMKHLEETYKYKELDDELEEELRAEMCALALAGKTGPEGIEILHKESHRLMDDDNTVMVGDQIVSVANLKQDPESDECDLKGDNVVAGQVSTLPSFSFSVRPPSEEQSRSEDTTGMSPMNASLTIEGMGASSWSSMDSNRLAVTPSMTGSSPSSERSVRISSPPIKRAPSPYLLSLQGGHPGSFQRRPLVKQYSMDVGSDPQLNNINNSMSDVWDKFKETHKPVCRGDHTISRSQPSLKDLKSGSLEGKIEGSMDSKEGPVSGERMAARDRIKHKLLRSRSSGAKYSRFRDKYKQSNLNKAANQNTSDTSLSKEKIKRPHRAGSNETGSDMDESLFSDWGSEEAACDLEVKMITGGTEDEEDDIHPTLSSPHASEDRDNGHLPHTSRNMLDSAASSNQSTSRGDSTPRVLKPAHPKCKSPMPPPIKPRNNPGIDNTSFELGEEIHLPPCCRARETAAVRRSNSFSPSKLAPKAFSPPMVISPRSDRSLSPYGYREHTSLSPLALPPSPLALEDSTYRLRTPESGMRDMSVSPVPFSHSHMLSVPSLHSSYSNPHMRSPSPTPPKQVHLIPPSNEGPLGNRRQAAGSPAPIRRQHTLTRSTAIDHDASAPAASSSMRRHIPHTLSMDSAFLAPPGPPQSYSINDPYVEHHAGCRAASPLPSPRNSQQTLPGMFTRSVSPSINQQVNVRSPSPQPQQSSHLAPSLPSSTATVTIVQTSPEAASKCLSIPVPTPNAKSKDTNSSQQGEELISLTSSPTREIRQSSVTNVKSKEDDSEKSDEPEDKL